MIKFIIRIAVALTLWIIGIKVLWSTWVPLVEKYDIQEALSWIFAGYVFWTAGWAIIVCVLSYHVTLKTLLCHYYIHNEGCRRNK